MHHLTVSNNVTFFLWQCTSVLQHFLSLARFQRPFCAMNPPISNLLNSLLYSFLEILFFFVLQSPSFWLLWQGPCRLRESEFVLTSCHDLSCLLATASNSSLISVPFSVSQMPSIFCTKSILHPACPLFLPNHDLPIIAFTIFPNILTNTLVLSFSCTCCLFHISDIGTCWPHSTPLRSVVRFLSFLVHNSQLFFRLRLELITVLPTFHQAVKASCMLQSCIHLCSLLLDCLCSSIKCLKPSIMPFLLLSRRPATIL